MMEPLRAAAAFWTLDRIERWSYPLAILNRGVWILTMIFLFYYGGRSLTGSVAGVGTEDDIFLFAMTGFATLQLMNACVGTHASRVRASQYNGVLEACLMTRTPIWQILLVMPSYALGTAVVRFVILLSIAIGLGGAGLQATMIPLLLAVLLMGSLLFLSLGVVSAVVTMVTKQGDPLSQLLVLASWLIAGTFVPREALPPFLGDLGAWVPIAPVIDGIRAILASDGAATAQAFAMLAGWTIVAAVAAIAAARTGLRRVLQDGSLAHY